MLRILNILIVLTFTILVNAQSVIKADMLLNDSMLTVLKNCALPTPNMPSIKGLDSTVKQTIVKALTQNLHNASLSKPVIPKRIHFSEGYLQYGYINMNYKDSSILEQTISQHMLQFSSKVTIGNLPLRFNYIGQRFNNAYYHDSHMFDIGLDFSAYKQQLKPPPISFDKNVLAQQLSVLEGYKNIYNIKLGNIDDCINAGTLHTQVFDAKEHLQKYKDSVQNLVSITKAKGVIALYDTIIQLKQIYAAKVDSLEKLYEQYKTNLSAPVINEGMLKEYLGNQMPKAKSRLTTYQQWLQRIQRFKIGSTIPNTSNLFMSNNPVNGIDIAYKIGNTTVGVVAGFVSNNVRNTFNFKGRFKQPMASVQVTHQNSRHTGAWFTTALAGKKLASYNSYITYNVMVLGIGYVKNISKTVQLTTELSTSSSNRVQPLEINQKPNTLSNNAAYLLGLTGNLFKGNTQFNAEYRSFGNNYNAYVVNRINNSKQNSFKANVTQKLYKSKAEINVGVQHNIQDVSGAFNVINNRLLYYNANVKINIHKNHVLSGGYIPFKTLVKTDSLFIEQAFQLFFINSYHQHKLGTALLTTNIAYSKNDNSAEDVGYISNDATSISLTQHINFTHFNINWSANNSQNQLYVLKEFSAGLGFTHNTFNYNGGVKIFNINTVETKLGYHVNIGYTHSKYGNLSVQANKVFIPSTGSSIVPLLYGSINYVKQIF